MGAPNIGQIKSPWRSGSGCLKHNFRIERVFKIHVVLVFHVIDQEMETQTGAAPWGVLGATEKAGPG